MSLLGLKWKGGLERKGTNKKENEIYEFAWLKMEWGAGGRMQQKANGENAGGMWPMSPRGLWPKGRRWKGQLECNKKERKKKLIRVREGTKDESIRKVKGKPGNGNGNEGNGNWMNYVPK
jgi:hypothetical protein